MGRSAKVSKSHPFVKAVLAACFPAYKGRKVFVELKERVFYDPVGGGGSWDKAVAVSLASGAVAEVPCPSPWSSEYLKLGNGVALPEGMALAVHSWFQGKDCGIRIYVNPAMPPKLGPVFAGLLPAAEVL